MSNELSSLMVTLGANTAAYQQDIGRAADTSVGNFDRIVGSAKNMAVALGAAFAIDGIREKIKEQIDYADGLSDIAARSNQTTESLSAMEYALHFSDATLDDYTGGLQKLSLNMVAASEGNKEQAALFDTLGIKVRSADGSMRNAADVMFDISDKLSGMEDGATKTNVAMDLLGKSAGPALLPALNQGSAALKDLTAEAAEFNLVVSTDASNAAGEFNDNLDKMGFVATGTWRVIAQSLSPALGQISTDMLKSAKDTNALKFAADALSWTIKALYVAVGTVSFAFKAMGDIGGKAAAIIAMVADGDLAGAKAIWADDSVRQKNKADLAALGDVMRNNVAVTADQAISTDEINKKTAETLRLEKELAALKNGSGAADKKLKQEKPLTYEQKLDKEYGADLEGISISTKFEEQQRADEEKRKADAELAKATELESAVLEYEAKFDAEKAYQDRVAELKKKSLDDDLQNRQIALGFATQSFAQMGQKHKAFADAGIALNKVMALKQIYQDTPVAAMAASKAVAGIPFVGPTLATIAYGSMIALGVASAASVLSGGGSSAPSAGTSSANFSTASQNIQPIAQQKTEQEQIGTVIFPEDGLITPRGLVDFLNEAFVDGKQLRFATT